MADKYVTLFDTLYGGAKWDVGVAINRSNALPLDRNSIFPSFELARAYAAMDEAAMKAELINLGINTASKENVKINNNAYAGQVLAVVTATETTIYYIDANKELQEVGGKVGVDGASIKADENGNLYIGGFDSAEALTLPQKQADGSILWIPISSIVEGDGNTKTYVAAANNSVVVEKTEETEERISYTVAANISDKEGNILTLDEKGLYVPTPEEYDDAELRDLINEKANASALDNFYNKESIDGVVNGLDQRITTNANAIEALTNGTSTEEIDSVMELVEYVNEHGAEVTGIKADIKANADAIDVIEAKPAMEITSQNIADWNDAVSKEHIHENKDVLDGISSTKVAAWDAAEKNAKDYADGLVSPVSEKVTTLESGLATEKGRIDTIAADYLTSEDKTNLENGLGGLIEDEKERAEGEELKLSNRIKNVEDNYLSKDDVIIWDCGGAN